MGKFHVDLLGLQVKDHIHPLAVGGPAEYQLLVFDDHVFVLSFPQGGEGGADGGQTGQVGAQALIQRFHLLQFQVGPERRVGGLGAGALDGPLAAVVEGGDARHGVQQGVHVVQVGGVGQLAGQTIHVVVVREIIEGQIPIDAPWPELAVEGVGDLEIVFVVVGGPQALPALVIGDGVQHLRVGPPGVVPVDDLPHEPEVRITVLHKALEGAEEVKIHAVGGVQPQAVDVEGIHPHAHRVQQVAHHVGVAQVELHQLVVALPGGVPEGVPHGGGAAEVQVVEPAAVGRALALLPHVLEGPEFPAHVVEYPVQHHPDAVFVELLTQLGEGVVVSQAAVNLEIVGGVVAVLHRLEHRPQVQGVDPQLLQVGDPVVELLQPLDRLAEVVVLRCPAEPQGIDMVEHGIGGPMTHNKRLRFNVWSS